MDVYKGIYLVKGIERESNIYVVDSELIIDTGTGSFFPEAKEEIRKNCDPRTIRSIINTHYHFDNTGGNKKFRDWLGAELLIHENDKRRTEQGDTLAEKFNAIGKIVTFDNTIKEGDVFRTENFSFIVIHTPGHTPGSICLYEPDKKILISGDTLLSDSIGRFDLPESNRLEMKRSLEKLANYNIDYMLPGHGRPKKWGIGFQIQKMINSPNPSNAYWSIVAAYCVASDTTM